MPGTIPQRTAAVRRVVSEAVEGRNSAKDDVIVEEICAAALGDVGRGELDRRIAALAASQAQRQIALTMGRRRTTALALVDAARRRLATGVDAGA